MLYRRKMFHTILSGAAQCRKTWSIYQSKKKQTLLLHQLTFHIYIHSFNAMYSHRCQLRHGQNLLSLHFPSQTFYHFPFYTQLLCCFSHLTQDKINSLSLKNTGPYFIPSYRVTTHIVFLLHTVIFLYCFFVFFN